MKLNEKRTLTGETKMPTLAKITDLKVGDKVRVFRFGPAGPANEGTVIFVAPGYTALKEPSGEVRKFGHRAIIHRI